MPGLCCFLRVTRRKLQTPGTAEEHKRQETPTINPNDRQPTQLTDQAPSTIERAARDSRRITQISTAAVHAFSTATTRHHHPHPTGSSPDPLSQRSFLRVTLTCKFRGGPCAGPPFPCASNAPHAAFAHSTQASRSVTFSVQLSLQEAKKFALILERSSKLFHRSDPNSVRESCYKRVKGRSHTVEKRKAIHTQKPHATSQPSRFSHTPRLSTDAEHN